MPLIEIPGRGTFALSHLVLDLNGTLTTDGVLLPGVAERIEQLRDRYVVHMLTADTRGTADRLAQDLRIHWVRVEPGGEATQKRALVTSLGAEAVIAMGNGANDGPMLEAAAVGIAVLGEEGVASAAFLAADLLARDICSALDMLLHPTRLIATLRV